MTSSFGRRLGQAAVLVNEMSAALWHAPGIASSVELVPYGYENHIAESVRTRLRYVRTPTARYIRFTPDYFLLDLRQAERTSLLEVKVTQTPVYSDRRVSDIARHSERSEFRRSDLGQMEADAYDNYMLLATTGLRVVVLVYCAYHARPLLCDLVQNIVVLHRDAPRGERGTGSGTPFVNYDCCSLRELDAFLDAEHSVHVPPALQGELVARLKKTLPVTPHQAEILESLDRRTTVQAAACWLCGAPAQAEGRLREGETVFRCDIHGRFAPG